uniref:non-specific serine/threonine protein kinase n=1 Tax=Oryza nivara TaxID=4536 RepID=A0A0E0I5N7_ORYNI
MIVGQKRIKESLDVKYGSIKKSQTKQLKWVATRHVFANRYVMINMNTVSIGIEDRKCSVIWAASGILRETNPSLPPRTSSSPRKPHRLPPLHSPPDAAMLRRAIGLPAAAGRAASSRWRGFLTVSFDLEDGKHERAEFKLSVPWGSASASPSGDAIERAVSSEGCKVDTSRLTMNSMGKGGVIASSVLMTATNFDASKARSRRGRGRQMNLVDIHIWPQESRAAATLMRKNDKSRLAWHSTWSFDMESTNSPRGKSLLTSNLSDKTQDLQYKGFICNEIANEFEVSLKNHFSIHQTLGERKVKCSDAVLRKVPIDLLLRDVMFQESMLMKSPVLLMIIWTEKKMETLMKLEFFKEAVLGINYLHQKGFIHRDIKPSNIFLDNLNNVKIGDFGSGAFMGSASCLGRGNRFWGTQFHAPPELWNMHTHSEKTDVFSLGILYFELFGGPTSSNGRYKRLEKLESILNSSKWKTNPLQTWLNCNIYKGWGGKVPVLIQMLQISPRLRPACRDILLMLS